MRQRMEIARRNRSLKTCGIFMPCLWNKVRLYLRTHFLSVLSVIDFWTVLQWQKIECFCFLFRRNTSGSHMYISKSLGDMLVSIYCHCNRHVHSQPGRISDHFNSAHSNKEPGRVSELSGIQTSCSAWPCSRGHLQSNTALIIYLLNQLTERTCLKTYRFVRPPDFWDII